MAGRPIKKCTCAPPVVLGLYPKMKYPPFYGGYLFVYWCFLYNSSNSQSGGSGMVWIPQSGSKYHSRSGCSNMKNPTQVTQSEAESMGYEPCKKCYW